MSPLTHSQNEQKDEGYAVGEEILNIGGRGTVLGDAHGEEIINIGGRGTVLGDAHGPLLLRAFPDVATDNFDNDENDIERHGRRGRPKSLQSCSAACGDFWTSSTTGAYFLSVAMIAVGVGLVVGGTILMMNYDGDDYPKRYMTMQIFGGILAVTVYCIYINMLLSGSKFRYWTEAALSPEQVKQHIAKVREARPRIVWTMTSFHKKLDSNGDTKRKVTWEGEQDFVFSYADDISDPPSDHGMEEFQHTRIKFSKTFSFADAETEAAFILQKLEFITNNLGRDERHEVKTELVIPGYVESIMATTNGRRPCLVNEGLYVLCVMLLLELPFGFLLRLFSGKRCYQYSKNLKS
ncbi:hypothetical protein BV898_03118 [Hypsibius exemplaris]|uniref:Uncharacterized protein n=1 Tax=Hypsibius exemplaris TaxID=2072580 RepID=A0A1W0X6Y1_HYPEX|nr:hypothetical protein BV898_03118 [Hypsibius exemplaris]